MKTLHTIYNNFAKRNLSSLRLLLVMLLTLTASTAWAETYSWTCSGSTVFSTSGSSLNGFNWKASIEGSSAGTGVSGEKCVQIAKNNGLTLETTGFNNKNITSISIQTWGSQENTFYLKDGDTQLATTQIPKSYSSNGAKISFSDVGVIKTKLVFSWSSATKAFNVRSITITYEDAAPLCSVKPTVGTPLQSVTATENSITATIPISSIGGCDITENGLVYSTTNSTPTVDGSGCTKVTTTACGSTAANKTVTITGLTCGQSYNIRGYATNEAGTSYTNVTTESTSDCPKYTVTLMDDNSTLTQSSAGESVTLPPRNGCDGYEFVGWTKSWYAPQTSWTTTAPTIIPAGSYTPTGDENLYPVYTKTEGGGTSYQFQQVTALSQIKAGGTFIITNGSYYLPNTQASSSGPLKADMVEVTNGVVTGTVTDAMKWTFSEAADDGKITIKSAANSTHYLYTTSDNNGLRVNNTSDTWTFEEYTVSDILGFAMKSTSNSRYCAVYTDGSDWRSYTTKNAGNYETNSGRLDLYKYTEISSSTTYYISVPDCDPCNALQAPNVTAKNITTNSFTLSWAAVAGATSYNIYNYTTNEGYETTDLTYTFNGLDPNTEYEWEVEAVSATCDGKGTTGTTTTLETYTITWKNADGTVLETDENVPHGTTPTYNGATPTKPATEQYTYTFSGWSPEVYAADKDQIYTAQFNETTRQYTVTFDANGHGTAPDEQSVDYGTKATEPTAPTAFGYTFGGWYKEEECTNVWDFATDVVTGTITLYAKWTEKALTRYRTDCDACIPLDGYAEINGTYHFFPGETITLTVTPPADDVPYTYQWQKKVNSDYENIEGEKGLTYTKENATTSDVGHYRCVVSSEGYCDLTPDFDVKCLQLYVYYDNKSDMFNTPLNRGAEENTATISVDLQNANYTYHFKITDGCGNWYGNTGTMVRDNCTNWPMDVNEYCGLQTTKFGTYVFNVNYSDLAHLTVSVIYPAAYQAAGKEIYLDNNVLNWTHSNNAEGKNKIYYRIGRSNHNSKTAMTKVPGTANLYKVTTGEYDNFEVWHIANNGCWSEDNSIFKTKTGDDWAATQATAFETLPVTFDVVTVTPTTLRSVGGDENNNNNCNFYNYDITEGMKTWNAEVIEPTNGTITVKYTHHDGTAVNDFTSGTRDLAHTCLLTITATPNAGYSLTSLTVNDVPFTSGNVHTLTADAVIEATFTINNYNVTWKLNGGNIGGDESDIVQTYQYGAAIKAPEKPTLDCYEFVEWTPTYNAEMTMPAEDLVFTATWNKLSYTITFQNWDGSELQSSTVECGETPSYTGATPTREQDAMYEYEFAGWTPTVAEATGDQIYTATYNSTKRQYTVTWFVDGKQIDSESVAAGDLATAPEVNPIPCGAVLAGWTDAENGEYVHGTSTLYEGAQPSIEITDNKTFYAVFADRETIIPKLPENIVYWENQEITAGSDIDATIGEGTLTSNVTLDDPRDRTYMQTISTAAQITLEDLKLKDYNNINLSFWARGSAKGTFTIMTNVDNDPIGTVTLTGDERLYIIENIPSDATSITLTYSANTGSLFFGTVKIYEDTHDVGTFTKLTAENTNGWTGSDWDGYYLITNASTKALDGNAIGEYSIQTVEDVDNKINCSIRTAFHIVYNSNQSGYSVQGVGDGNYLQQGNKTITVSSTAVYLPAISYNSLKGTDNYELQWNGDKCAFYASVQSAPQMYKIMSELSNYRTLCVYDIEYTNTFDVAHANPETYTVADLPLTFTAPTSIREGYTFAGWRPASLDENTRDDQEVEAQWTANTNTPYVVMHYKEQLDGTYPTEADDTDNLTGTTATSVTPAVKTYEGFTAPSTQTVSIAADGSTVVTYQYTRNSYNLSWNVNEGDALTGEYTSGNVKYEAAITQPNTPTRTGYTFIGWSPAEIPATMPANNLEFIAQWEALPAYDIYWMVNGAPADGEPTTSVFEGQYITNLPTTPDVDCNGKEFVGWTTAEIVGETATIPDPLYTELGDFPAVTSNMTFYAVFAKGSGDERWIETEINDIEATDEVVIAMQTSDMTYAMFINDDATTTPVATVVEPSDLTSASGIATGSIWFIEKDGNGKLIIHPKKDIEKNLYCNLSTSNDRVRVGKSHDNHELYKTFEIDGNYLKNSVTQHYIGVNFTHYCWYGYTDKSNFPNQTLKFYKKTIVYTSYTNYSTSCVAGEFDITNTDPIYVTSAVGQKVKAHDKLVLTTTDMAVGTEISLSAPNITFYKEGVEITQLTTESAEETFELEIAYQPTAENTIEQPTITLDILGQKFTFDNKISCRSLPETFAIVAKVGNVWYALPSQGLNSTTPPAAYPVEVDDMADPTTVTAVPASADWSLRQVYAPGSNDRFTANGDNLVFVNNASPAMTLNASSSEEENYLLTGAQYDDYHNTTNPGLYEWTPTTTDLETYQLTNEQRSRTLSVNTATVFGVHAQNKAVEQVRFLPITGRYTPAALQVVEWKENSVVIMYNGNPAQTASVSVNGSAAEETILSSEDAQRDIAVYELAAPGLAANPTQRLSITIGSEKTILSIPYIIINSETTDVAVLPGTTVAARQEVAKVSDLVILKGATLTAAGASNNLYKFRNVTIYGGGKLVIPADNGFGVNSLTLRIGGVTADGNYDYVYPEFVLNGKYTSSSGKINLDYVTTKEQYYTFVAPFEVKTKDIHYPVDIYGNNVAANNTGSFEFEYYDGATRATGATGWKTVEEGTDGATLELGQGYTFLGMPKKVKVNGGTSTRQKFGIHRIPMTVTAENARIHENSEQTITVAPHPAEKNINAGWNLIGNPYMSTITGLDNQSIQTGTIVWNDNKWEWSNASANRFIVFPSNDGQWYTTAQASNATLPAFKNFFVQISNEGANALVIPYTSRTNPSAAPARHAAEEIDRDIELAIVLEKDEQNADQMDFLLNNTYGPAFDRNADFTKMMNNTNFNLYGVHLDDCLSFVAIDQYTAAQPVAIGYQVPTAGEYMLRMSDKPYVMADRIKALYVTDHEMTPEVTTDILKEPYRFTVGKAETNHTRFTISIELKPNTGDGVTTGWENVDVGKDQPIKFIYQDKLYILRNGVIYDATGKFVQTINK